MIKFDKMKEIFKVKIKLLMINNNKIDDKLMI